MKNYLVRMIIPATQVEVVGVLASDHEAACNLVKQGFGVHVETTNQLHAEYIVYDAKEM